MDRRRAFTLIELLVVVAIVGLLAAMLFPVFAQAKEAAKKMTCISNLRNMALGTVMYVGDHDDGSYQTQAVYAGRPPGGSPASGTLYVYWYGLVWNGAIYPEYSPVWPYLKSQAIQRCQSARGYYRASSNVTDVGFAPNMGTFGNLARAVNVGGMVRPAETIMYADSAGWSASTGLMYPVTGTMACGPGPSVHARHTGVVGSVAWWDGHATCRAVWTSKSESAYQAGAARNRLGTLLKFPKDPSNLARPVGSDDANTADGPVGYDCYYYQSTKKIEP